MCVYDEAGCVLMQFQKDHASKGAKIPFNKMNKIKHSRDHDKNESNKLSNQLGCIKIRKRDDL